MIGIQPQICWRCQLGDSSKCSYF